MFYTSHVLAVRKSCLTQRSLYILLQSAARAFDKAAICCRGTNAQGLNFPIEDYADEADRLNSLLLEELVKEMRSAVRARAASSDYTGVRRSTHTRTFESFIRVAGTFVSLGTYKTDVAAAEAHDQAAIIRHAHGVTAMGKGYSTNLVTNFPLDHYRTAFALGDDTDDTEQDDNQPKILILDEGHVAHVLKLCEAHRAAIKNLALDARKAETQENEQNTNAVVSKSGNMRIVMRDALQLIDPCFALQIAQHSRGVGQPQSDEALDANHLWLLVEALSSARESVPRAGRNSYKQ